MAAPKSIETPQQISARLDSGTSFTDKNITYSVGGDRSPIGGDGKPAAAGDHTTLTPAQQAYAKEAFEMWDDLIPKNLFNIESGLADISINYSDKVSEKAGGLAYRHTTGDTIDSADIVVPNRPGHADGNFTDFGSHAQETYIHEVGHALGLSHPGKYDALKGDTNYKDNAEFVVDTQQHSVMSYFRPEEAGGDHTDRAGKHVYAQTPMVQDVHAIQAKYGADMTTRAGDTTYGFNSTADRTVFDFAKNDTPVLTIWDGGGNDTLDVSGFNGNQDISLTAGAYSSVGNKHGKQDTELTNNVGIAYGAKIENAVGGRGNDKISGNYESNKLTGGAGNDTIDGGHGGNDTLDGGSGADLMKGGVGNDTYIVDNAGDRVIDQPLAGKADAAAGHDTIITTLKSYDLGAADKGVGIEDLKFHGNSDFKGTGNALDNSIMGGLGRDTLDGGAGNDKLNGGAGNDRLAGGIGNDTLQGGLGNDTMTGGAGTDVFKLDSGWGNDRITDFTHGVDKIDMSTVGGLVKFDQLKLTDTKEGVMVAYGDASVLVDGQTTQTLTAGDFIL